jgi:hypothetical protein
VLHFSPLLRAAQASLEGNWCPQVWVVMIKRHISLEFCCWVWI